METEKHYIKIEIKSLNDLPKEAGTYIACNKKGEIYEYHYIKIDEHFTESSFWLKYISWYFLPLT